MTFDWNKPFQARNGCKARRVSAKGAGARSNIVIYGIGDGCEGAGFVTNEGRIGSDGTPSPYDLVNIEPALAPAPAPAPNSFDPSKPFTTRDGKKAEIIGALENDPYGDTSIVRYTDEDGRQYVGKVQPNGRSFKQADSADDLVNIESTPAPAPVSTSFDPSKSFTARNGDKAEIVGTLQNKEYGSTFIVRYITAKGEQWCGTVLRSGQAFKNTESEDDLVNVKTKRVAYAGIYARENWPPPNFNIFGFIQGRVAGPLYSEEADVPVMFFQDPLVHTVRIEWEE